MVVLDGCYFIRLVGFLVECMNNTGKTSFLKALQIALGNRQFVSQDDFFIKDNRCAEQITIDVLIVPLDANGKQSDDFSEDWEVLFTTDRIRTDGIKSFLPLRTTVTFDAIKNSYKVQQTILKEWFAFEAGETDWLNADKGNKTTFRFDELPFFYMDAQRDILEDTKLRSSYLGKMLSKIKYSTDDIKAIEQKIEQLNEKAVSSSDILSNIKETLKGLDSALDNQSGGIDCIKPIRFARFKSKPFFKNGLLHFIAVFNGIKGDGGSKW
jgi:putative ATP-dependent endonuclease of OLD family